MNFEASSDILALQSSLAKLLGEHYTVDKRRAIAACSDGFSRPLWGQLAEMGLPGLTADPAYGGFGLPAADLLPILEELGRGLVLEPFIASSMVGVAALQAVAGPALLAELMPSIVAGTTIITLAHGEPGARHDPAWVRTRATKSHAQWLLSGHKREVMHGVAADYLLVSATIDTAANPADYCLFLVARNAPGMVLRPYRLVDDSPAAELRMGRVAPGEW